MTYNDACTCNELHNIKIYRYSSTKIYKLALNLSYYYAYNSIQEYP